jgi:NADH-quinone oxidoreductase subunit G
MQAGIKAAGDAGEAPVASVATGDAAPAAKDRGDALYRVGEVPMFAVDALCRRAPALQQTMHARSDFVGLNPADAGRLGLKDGDTARIDQHGASAELEVRVSERVPAGAAWVRSASCSARELGSATGPIRVEAA